MGAIGTLFAVVAVVAIILVVELARMGRRRGSRLDSAASARARDVALAALDAVRRAREADARLSPEELRVRGVMAASGEAEEQVRARVEKARSISPLHASLQMLVVGVAVRLERARAGGDSASVTASIVEAQKTVMGLIPPEL